MAIIPKPIRQPREHRGLKRTRMRKKAWPVEDQLWARAVREKDGHICQRCHGWGTEAHHVATRKRRPDLKHELSNGKTLCLDCHTWVHAHPKAATALGLLSTESYESRISAGWEEVVQPHAIEISGK